MRGPGIDNLFLQLSFFVCKLQFVCGFVRNDNKKIFTGNIVGQVIILVIEGLELKQAKLSLGTYKLGASFM